MFQTPLSIKQVLQGINHHYFLPAIQREFVWDEDQILNLIDSILRGYPFGSFLVWKAKDHNIKKFEFYEFLKNYHQTEKRHNDKASVNNLQNVDAILDGQQRLTSLYIAFMGSYATKIPYRRYDDPTAFPARKLYLNLLECSNGSDDVGRKYVLEFKDPPEVENDIEWFEVGRILSMTISDVVEYSKNPQLPKISTDILSNLFQRVHDATINYYLEESDELHKVLNIFVRVNSGGTILSYSDLLLSIATAGFRKLDARKEILGIVDEINDIGAGFKINKDFILKTCLLLMDKDVRFSVDNFDVQTMLQMEESWSSLKQNITHSFTIASALGMNASILTSNYPVAIISYYLYKNELLANDIIYKTQHREIKKAIQKFLYMSLIKQLFSSALDTTLVQLRKAIATTSLLDLKSINNQMSINKKFDFSDDDIEQLLEYWYGHRFTFMLLALLYPSKDLNNIYHVDHIFPKSKFAEVNLKANGILDQDLKTYLEKYNLISNLQLLEGPANIDKLDILPEDWILAKYSTPNAIASYKRENYLDPSIPITYGNFLNYYDDRRDKMKSALQTIFAF